MVTSRILEGGAFLAFLTGALGACTTQVAGGGTGGATGGATASAATVTGTGTGGTGGSGGGAYGGKGFIVHEWGTDTVVVGSDGSLQRGLHHEEEDLPSFVYDRIKGGSLPGAGSVEVKMETPVTYFYSDHEIGAKVSVGFPKGVFTQWYPTVQSFLPAIAAPFTYGPMPALATFMDPVLDPHYPFGSQACVAHYGAIAQGSLDWGTVDILPRGAAAAGPEAPLDKFTWSYARQVAANDIQVNGPQSAKAPGQSERFLFYRGLGNFDLPVHATSTPGGAFSLANTYAEPVATVFALNVGANGGAFTAHPEGIAANGMLAGTIPSLDGAPPLDAFVDALAAEITQALDGTGLYHDEATAMVNTWKRQWFRTPGARLLYLVPQSWTEASIPLTITPTPDVTKRVMMIRVELITPELETADVAMAGKLGASTTDAAARAYFQALGRFAEPRLRRALTLLGQPANGAAFLAEITTANTVQAAGE